MYEHLKKAKLQRNNFVNSLYANLFINKIY